MSQGLAMKNVLGLFAAVLFAAGCQSAEEPAPPVADEAAPIIEGEQSPGSSAAFHRGCATVEHDDARKLAIQGEVEQLLRERAKNATAAAVTAVNVSVYFHVITNGGAGDLTQNQIDGQIRVLNDAYATSGVTFTLAAVDRTSNATWPRQHR
jgi:hypothetical protein